MFAGRGRLLWVVLTALIGVALVALRWGAHGGVRVAAAEHNATVCRVESVGGNPQLRNYGAWPLCTERLARQVRRNPTVLSVGSGCDATFELDLLRRYPTAQVHVFDPTITLDRFHNCVRQSAAVLRMENRLPGTFWPVGLGTHNAVMRFYRSRNPKIGSMTTEQLRGVNASDALDALVLEYDTLVAMLRVQRVNVLKMDIEGAEFAVIRSWCQRRPAVLPEQLLVEYHERLMEQLSFTRRDSDDCLQRLGYHKVVEVLPRKEEVLYVRRRWW